MRPAPGPAGVRDVSAGDDDALAQAALTTAYPRNARPRASQRAPQRPWAPAVERLRAAGHVFLPLTYAGGGCLFRGIARGLGAGLGAGVFDADPGTHRLCALERELGVQLLSQDLSDALAVARPWEAGADAAVLVVAAAQFEAHRRRRRAAVLGFAEPGVVFRYPFVVDPLHAGEVALVLACGAGEARTPGPACLRVAGTTRAQVEAAMAGALAAHGWQPARARPARSRCDYP